MGTPAGARLLLSAMRAVWVPTGINYPETYEASKFLVGGYLLLLVSRELLARMAE